MSDLRGFTALSSKMPAQSLIGLLNHYFEAMVAVISRYGGTVIEFLGDGIFVVFGAPKEMPDHASNAVKCAIGMQNAIKEVNKWTEENGYPELAMGIGINTGSVVVGNIGSENKMKYGCMGQTVNIAGRLEGLTVGGQVLITEHTRQMLTGEFESCSEGSFLPKGAKDELKYYEVSKLDGLSVDTNYSVIVWTDCDKKKYDLHTVKEKTVEAVGHQAAVYKISTDKKHALISCDYELQPRTNIMLQEGDNRIYAKVIRPEYDGYVICFTSVAQSV
jgi:adenylate cyclase